MGAGTAQAATKANAADVAAPSDGAPLNTGIDTGINAGISTETSLQGAIASIFSVESEELLIASALKEGGEHDREHLISTLSPDDFFLDVHAGIWQCARALAERNSPVSVPAVLDYGRANQIQVGEVMALITLMDNPLYSHAGRESVDDAVRRVKNYATLRRLDKIMQEGRQLCLAAPEQAQMVLTQIQDDLENLERMAETSSNGPVHIHEIALAVADEVGARMDGAPLAVVPSGFADLDNLITGFGDGDLIILAARPSMGKTAMMLNLASNISNQKIHLDKVLIFSTEMTGKSLGMRQISSTSGVSNDHLKRGTMNQEELSRFVEGVGIVGAQEIWIDDTPGITLAEIRARTRAFVRDHGRCTIMVDYLQNISASGQKETKDHVSECSGGLKTLGRELKCPVVALSQLNRGVEQRANKRPLMSDLRESGSIEQDADLIMFLYRDEYYNPDTKDAGITDVIVAKQRDGAVGTARLSFERTLGRFENVYSDPEYSYGY